MITTWDRAELPYINDLSTTSRKTFIWVKILRHFYCCAVVVVSPSQSPPSPVIEREQVLELLGPTILHQESANKIFKKRLRPIACSLHDGLFSIQVRWFRIMSSPPPAASTHLHQHRHSSTRDNTSPTSSSSATRSTYTVIRYVILICLLVVYYWCLYWYCFGSTS